MEKDGACKMDRQNKKCSCARKSGRRKNNAGTDKEEENKLAGPLAKKELSAEGYSRTGPPKLRPANSFSVVRLSRMSFVIFLVSFLVTKVNCLARFKYE